MPSLPVRLGSAVAGWARRSVVAPIKAQIVNGATPHSLALAFAVGLVGGIFPIPGLTTLAAVGGGAALGANLVVAQAINLMCTPLNLATVLPFMRLGRLILGAPPFKFDASSFSISHVAEFARPLFYGVLAWTLTAPIMVMVLYMVLFPVSRILMQRVRGDTKRRSEDFGSSSGPMTSSSSSSALSSVAPSGMGGGGGMGSSSSNSGSGTTATRRTGSPVTVMTSGGVGGGGISDGALGGGGGGGGGSASKATSMMAGGGVGDYVLRP